MATFKGQLAHYDGQKTERQNLEALFEEHNAVINKLSVALNNLDAQNFTEDFLSQFITREE